MRLTLILILGICGGIFVPLGVWAEAAPSLKQIVDRTVAHDELRQKMLLSMQYEQTANIDELDDKDAVQKHETLEMIIYPGHTPSMKIVSVKGDHIPSDPDQAEAQAKGRDVEDNKHDFSLRTLVDRFNLSLEGETELDGHKAYVVAFTPKPGQPYHDQTEKIVNQLHGKIWVSTDTYDILQTDASLAEPISVAWFIAKISKLDFHYSRHDISKDFSPCQVLVTVQVHAPFVGFYERQTVDMKNFKPRS
jgi:hypothetical protein